MEILSQNTRDFKLSDAEKSNVSISPGLRSVPEHDEQMDTKTELAYHS